MGGKNAGLNKVSRKRHTMKLTVKQTVEESEVATATHVLRKVFHRGNSECKGLYKSEVDGETAH